MANRYTRPANQTGEIIDSGHPYRTRLIVRRPKSASNFNRMVIVEWNNVTAGPDKDIDWWMSGDHFIREGYAYVSASVQQMGGPIDERLESGTLREPGCYERWQGG
ncbi:hypothetical protein F7C95_05115 [Opitutia bacterium ISCC 51]|nr:hypothetical protein F7C95_05115 [Opitutae bacterium ISCC 51]QXD29349.1 hypothetical protein GA003_05095 [Opitutae bacterium ISCC 52]